jgi:hypothetical protein
MFFSFSFNPPSGPLSPPLPSLADLHDAPEVAAADLQVGEGREEGFSEPGAVVSHGAHAISKRRPRQNLRTIALRFANRAKQKNSDGI